MNKKFIIVATLTIAVFGIVFLSNNVKRWLAETDLKASAPCVNRLAVISGCKAQWALEHQKTTNDVPTWEDIRPYLPNKWTNSDWTNGQPRCPDGGTYTLGRVGEPPTCSIGGPRHSLPK
jgi:hypothetical protein